MAPLHLATLTVQRELPKYEHLGSLPYYLCTKNETDQLKESYYNLADLFKNHVVITGMITSLATPLQIFSQPHLFEHGGDGDSGGGGGGGGEVNPLPRITQYSAESTLFSLSRFIGAIYRCPGAMNTTEASLALLLPIQPYPTLTPSPVL